MKVHQYLGRSLAATGLALVLVAGASWAQQPAKEFEPQVGQSGKDVIWVPTQLTMVNRMLDTAKVTASDFVIDLGSGDGRTVITAAKRGATAQGIEYNPDMVALSQKNAEKEGVTAKATFAKADIFESDFSKASVITMFLLTDINYRLRPKILDMKPGTRVVSNTFDMGDWEADEKFEVKEGCTSYCRGFYWVVPAKVEGTWKVGASELALKQTYQMLTGTLKTGNVIAPLKGRLTGDSITFTAGDTTYTGKVNGNAIEGVSKAGSTEAKWQASKG
jgi:SAM-dependent methyltransferase